MTLEEMVQQLRDALVVTDAMTLRHEQRIKEQQEWLEIEQRAIVRHQAAIEQHEAWLQQHEAAMQSITEKLDRLEDLLLRGQGGNGRHSA